MKLLTLILCFLMLSSPAFAQDMAEEQDSFTFTMDDGIMTQEEMEKEAQYAFRLCDTNIYQRAYFDCQCVAGAYLLEREKAGPMKLQSAIFDDIMRKGTARCANTEQIAGDSYTSCMAHVNTYRELSPDKEGYCTCVANKTANDFTKYPRLDIGYIENIRLNSMVWCDNPQNRPQKAASKTR